MSVLRIDAITSVSSDVLPVCLLIRPWTSSVQGFSQQEASNNMLESSIIRLLFIFLFSKTLYSYVEIVRLKEIIVCLLAVEAGKSVLGSNYCL